MVILKPRDIPNDKRLNACPINACVCVLVSVRRNTSAPTKIRWEPATWTGFHKRLSSLLPATTWPVSGWTNQNTMGHDVHVPRLCTKMGKQDLPVGGIAGQCWCRLFCRLESLLLCLPQWILPTPCRCGCHEYSGRANILPRQPQCRWLLGQLLRPNFGIRIHKSKDHCSKIQTRTRLEIGDVVATMAANRPNNLDPEAWYEAAVRIDQNRAMNAAFWDLVEPPKAHQLPLHKPKFLEDLLEIPGDEAKSSDVVPPPRVESDVLDIKNMSVDDIKNLLQCLPHHLQRNYTLPHYLKRNPSHIRRTATKCSQWKRHPTFPPMLPQQQKLLVPSNPEDHVGNDAFR